MGYEVHLLTDCISSRTAENKTLAIERMKTEGVRLTSVEMALFELLKWAKGKQFREIITLIKSK
ncbi:MAG: isochorismatase family protein [Desulfobacterota bacterium]|nr:isochorismatase family protein [Thermodesulfobacteriota bacterium]